MWKNPYTSLRHIEHHHELCTRLHRIIDHWDQMPHLYVHGPPGSGKKQLIMGLLIDRFGSSVSQTTIHNENLYFYRKQSMYHLEYFLTEKTGLDFITDFIQRVQFMNVITASFHIAILHGIELTTPVISNTIQRIIDEYYQTVRVIIISRSTRSSLMNRCLCIRVPIIPQSVCQEICLRRSKNFSDGKAYWEECNGNLTDIFIHIEDEYQKSKNDGNKLKVVNIITVKTILTNLHKAIVEKDNKKIQTYIYQLYVSPSSLKIIISEIVMYCIEQETDDNKKYKIVEMATMYTAKNKYITNTIYILITFCYHLTTIISS